VSPTLVELVSQIQRRGAFLYLGRGASIDSLVPEVEVRNEPQETSMR
jgi:hypothetical protein